MATSAFKSTTRRTVPGKSEQPSVPSTPRSKRDPSPSGRSLHRRSTSMTDFSARYLSDCSSSTADRRSSRTRSMNVRGGRHSVCPSDSESDMECLSSHRPNRRWSAESEDERCLNVPFSASSVVPSQGKGLRRTLSSQDFSQYTSKPTIKPRQSLSVIDKKPGNDVEDLVEEKTIRAVFAQMKSLRNDPPVGDVGMTDFLDAMRSEVRRAVADIRTDLEESMRKNSSSDDARNGADAQGTDVIQAVADIRKEYTAKLEESEKRVQDLWSQIAVEERRCLELSKIVKELLPAPTPPSTNPTSHTSSNRRRPLRRKNSAEKQLVLKSLDAEAQKYFDECVSISSLDCPADSDDSMREKENNSRHRRSRSGNNDLPVKSGLGENNTKTEAQQKDTVIGSDGVVLPWLQWEAESTGGNDATQEAKKQATKSTNGTLVPKANVGNNQFYLRNSNQKLSGTRKSNGRTSNDGDSVVSASKLQFGKSPTMPFFALDDNVVEIDSELLGADDVLLERIKHRCRIENGQLLLCQGLFLM